MGNALSVTPPPGGTQVYLIDPLPRIAPWAWDAAYCQTLDANTDARMVHRLAEARRALGLNVPEPPVLDHLAVILLAWLGAHRWWSTAFRLDYGWIELPVFEANGFPRHRRGVVAEAPGLYFVGLQFQNALNSTLLGGVGEEARWVVGQMGAS